MRWPRRVIEEEDVGLEPEDGVGGDFLEKDGLLPDKPLFKAWRALDPTLVTSRSIERLREGTP